MLARRMAGWVCGDGLLLPLVLLLALGGCLPPARPEGAPVPQPSASPEADTGCSYFYYLWGKSAELEGPERYDEAIEAYEKALVCDPGADYVQLSRARLLFRTGRFEEAAAVVEGLVRRWPENARYVGTLGRLYILLDRPDRAEELYDRALARRPDDPDLLLLRGALYARQKAYDRAAAVLERAVAVAPDSAKAHLALARLYRDLKLFQRAVEEYRVVLRLAWTPKRVLELGRTLEAAGRLEEAFAAYEEGLAAAAGDDRIRQRLADVALRLGRTGRAVDLLRDLARSAVDEGERRRYGIVLGRILLDSGRYDEAQRHFAAMAADDPGDEEVAVLLAVSRYRAGRAEDALLVLDRLLADRPDAGRAVAAKARILADLHRFAGADRLLADAIAAGVEPLAELYLTRAGVLEAWGRQEAAAALFAEATARFSRDARLLFEFGAFLDRRGEKDEALSVMQRVLEIDANDPYALNYVGYTWAEAGVRLDEALDYCKRAVSQRPEDGYIRDSLGWVYFRLGRYQEAVRELARARELAPGDPTIAEHLGDALARAGQAGPARRHWQEALEMIEEALREADRQQVAGSGGEDGARAEKEAARDRLRRKLGLDTGEGE